VHEATTAQLGVAYPFMASDRLGCGQVLVGGDLAGGPFAHDPFVLYGDGVLTNPNITVLGQIGRGKSALVKSYLYRQAAFGRRVAVLDPKGEYGPLARALGAEPVKLSPRGATRINPLDLPDAASGLPGGLGGAPLLGEGRRMRLSLLGALAEATMRRRPAPVERLALEIALDACGGSPTLVEVVDRLLDPDPGDARRTGLAATNLEADGRDVGLELRRLVHGDLAGMFDGTTSDWVAGERDVLVVDLSEVYHSEALPALMVCAAAWLQAVTGAAASAGAAGGTREASSAGAARDAARTLFVVDEAWAVLSEVAVGRYLRSSWKLARARGLANIAVCHRASDLTSAGAAGSEEARLAEGLLADSETVVCYAQPASELRPLAGVLGCSVEEIAYLPTLRRGVALWRVAGRRYLVDHLLSSAERPIVDTDQRM
jgi:hypothetical protein